MAQLVGASSYHRKVVGSVPGAGTCRRRLMDTSLLHWCCSLSLPCPLKSNEEKMFLGEDKLKNVFFKLEFCIAADPYPSGEGVRKISSNWTKAWYSPLGFRWCWNSRRGVGPRAGFLGNWIGASVTPLCFTFTVHLLKYRFFSCKIILVLQAP